ncbi:hypothetical protein D3C73_1163060 [compost metagenome]
MGVSPIANPASRLRNPKPVAILRTDRLCSVLETRNHTAQATAASANTWYTTERTPGSFQLSRRRGAAIGALFLEVVMMNLQKS